MVIDGAVTLTFKVEERVVRHVHMGSLVSRSDIVNLELVGRGKSICHLYIKVAGMSVLTVCMEICKHY